MISLLLLLLAAPPETPRTKVCRASDPSKCANTTTVGGKEAIDVNVVQTVGGAGGSSTQGLSNDGGYSWHMDLERVGGVAANIGTGAAGTGTLRVATASDSSLTCNAGTNLNTSLLSTAANQTTLGSQTTKLNDGTTTVGVIAGTTALKTDLSSVAGTATATGNGTAAGSIRVSIASDTTGVVACTESGTWTVQPGNTANTTPWLATARVVGNTGAVVDAANNATAPANVVMMGVQLQSGAAATAGTAGQVGMPVAGLDHVLYARLGGPVPWSCFVPLTATATTECRSVRGAGIRAYVTNLSCSNGAATVQGVDVVFGTGTACATGTTALTHKYQMGTNATTTSPFEVTDTYGAGLVPTAATAICLRPTAATAFGCTLTGYDAQ